MPTYEYACEACGEHTEVHARLSDPPLERCPACGGAVRKVFHPAGIVFKGSGFYATDSRSKKKEAKTASTSTSTTGGTSEGGASSSGSSPSTETSTTGSTPSASSPSTSSKADA